MAYVAPNTTIYVCTGIPFDTTYKHTILFETPSAQQSYFQARIKYQYDIHTYQRIGVGKIRVEQCADDLYGVNYLCFQNTNFGSKWFYAFITHVEYVNNITTEITYDIDVMQTYLFNYSLETCFVEREHVNDDSIGANVILEPVDMGDVKSVGYQTTGMFDSYDIIVACAYSSSGIYPATGQIYGGLPSGVLYTVFENNDINGVAEYIDKIVSDNKEDSIVCIWSQPHNFTTTGSTPITNTYLFTDFPSTIDGYTPNNNKLFCYPYNYLCVDSGDDTAVYRYEWFNVPLLGAYQFSICGTTSPDCVIGCYPIGYNCGDSGTLSNLPNYSEGVTMAGFPQVAWSVDAFKSWLANGGAISTGLSLVGSGAQFAWGAAQLGVGNPYGASNITGAITGAVSTVNNVAIQASKGATGHGSQSGSLSVAKGYKDFYFRKMQISADYAKSVDAFFDRYGYVVNRLKVPNRTGRPYWNYVKTNNCILNGAAPADVLTQIAGIYDAGVTFWHTEDLGNYSLDNRLS